MKAHQLAVQTWMLGSNRLGAILAVESGYEEGCKWEAIFVYGLWGVFHVYIKRQIKL